MYFQAAVRLIMKMGGGHWGATPSDDINRALGPSLCRALGPSL